MHLRPEFGYTIDLIRRDGLSIARELDFLAGQSTPARDAMAEAVRLVGAALEADAPDALVLLGDRYETCAAGLAATLHGTPIVHLHGGEETEGAVDNAFRHALTKLSHLHLVSHEQHAERVRQMGERADSVVVVGAPGLDNLVRDDLPGVRELEAHLGAALVPPIVVTTVHPSTLGTQAPDAEVRAIADSMAQVPATYVVTQPNADPGNEVVRTVWREVAAHNSSVILVEALGEMRFWALLRIASAVLGNSSAGLVEAPAAGLPVVNVGDRQRGRLRSAHIIDVAADREAIAHALREALSPERRLRLHHEPSPYPSPPAAPRIVDALARWTPERPPRKRFIDRR